MSLLFVPTITGPKENLSRIIRAFDFDGSQVAFIASGPLSGILIMKQNPHPEEINFHISLKFTLMLENKRIPSSEGTEPQQEFRFLRFYFGENTKPDVYHLIAKDFLESLMTDMPVDYGSFFSKLMKMVKFDFPQINVLEIETRYAEGHEKIAIPDASKLTVEREIEEVSRAHVQEMLEKVFPDGLTVETIAEALRTDFDVVENFLAELEELKIAKRCGENEWIRAETIVIPNSRKNEKELRPTIAIITCLFKEKLAVDAIIEDALSIHKYKSGGDSNSYTIGKIGKHTVVATKLAMIGDSMEATISAGSITTRILGNFQYIDHVFILGTAGGVPHYASTESHVRRGDVVISTSNDQKTYCYAHSFNRSRLDEGNSISGVNVRYWNPKDNQLARVLGGFSNDDSQQWKIGFDQLVENLSNLHPDYKFSKPSDDSLAMPAGNALIVVDHPDSRTESIFHLAPVGSMCSFRFTRKSPETGEDSNANHFDDSFGHANDGEKELQLQVKKVRQDFISANNLRALDAGFDSVIAAIEGSRIDSWAVVLGICDYSQGNSRGAEEWKPYAAAKAASLLREAILRL